MRRVTIMFVVVGSFIAVAGCAGVSRNNEVKDLPVPFDPNRKLWIEDWSQIHPRKQQ